MKKTLIIANWKMNPSTAEEANRLFNYTKKGIDNMRKSEIVICPPFPFISFLDFKNSNFKLGAQNCFTKEKGSFTGEVSALQLKSLNCNYVIIGHSERREYFNEPDEQVNKKIKIALKAGLTPIFCFGENKDQRNKNNIEKVLIKQIEKGLKDVKTKDISKIIFAYEPVWAIGTGHDCPLEEVQTINLFLKKIIFKKYNLSVSKNISIIYGGSVNSKNARDFIKETGMSGILVGGASLKSKEFIKIVKEINS